MASPHVVRDFSFAVSFASEELAMEQHNRLGSFLSGRLMAVVDDVFSELSPDDGSVARIENLDVDLGEFPISSYYEDVETRLRERLAEALRLKLFGMGGAFVGRGGASVRPGGAGSHNGGASEGIVSARQNELDLFVHFVETGYLPWHIHTLSRTMLDDLLGRILLGQGLQLAARLRAVANKQSAAARLAAQFPEDLLAGIAGGLDANWKDLAEDFRDDDGRPDWAGILLALMNGRSGQVFRRDWTVLRRTVEGAVKTGDAEPMRSFWAEMLADNPGLLAEVVREVGASVEVRRRMAAGFPEPVLIAIASVLEPREGDFLATLAGSVDSLRALAKGQRANRREVTAWFWEFTLTHLLVASGGRFERRAYLESVCREIGARWGVDYETARGVLVEELGQAAATGDLRRAASRPLAEPHAPSEEIAANGTLRQAEQRDRPVDGSLAVGDANNGGNHRNSAEPQPDARRSSAQPESLRPELRDVRSNDEDVDVLGGVADRDGAEPARVSAPWTLQLETALATGDAAPIVGAWGSWMRDRKAEIARVVRRFGLDADEVRGMAQKFPLPMLRDIAEALEPTEIQFVEYLCGKPALIRGEAGKREVAGDAENDPVETRLLWEFTFNYLLVERGSEFNRRSYLASVARGMAAHDNLRYEDLVDSMIASLEETPRPSVIGANLLAILTELSNGRAPGMTAGTSADDLGSDQPLQDGQHGLRLGEDSVTEPGPRGGARGLLTEFKRRFLLSAWAAGVDREELLADALRRFAFAKGASMEEIRASLLAELASLPGQDERLRRLLQELRVESGLSSSQSESQTLTVAEVIRSCELFDFLAAWISGAEDGMWMPSDPGAAASELGLASDLHLSLDELYLWIDELQRDYPWQLKRLVREAKIREGKIREARIGEARIGESLVDESRATPIESLDGSMPDDELRELARALLASRGSRRSPALERAMHPATLSDEELEEFLVPLKGSGNLGSSAPRDVARLVRTLEILLAEPQEWFRGWLRRAVAHDSVLRQLIGILPERQLARILFLSAGPGWHRLLAMADMILAAALSGGYAGRVDVLHGLKWRALFEVAKSHGRLAADYEQLATDHGPNVSEVAARREFVTLLSRQLESRGGMDFRSAVLRELRRETSPSGAESRRRILEALDPAKPRGATPPKRATRRASASNSVEQTRSSDRHTVEPTRASDSAAETDQSHIYILNAGQVLAAPYMPRLFQMTGLVVSDPLGDRFVDADAAERGVHLLQYLVDQSTGTPEHLLPLNKILCGLEPHAPIARDVDLQQAEKDAAEGLLGAMIAHWTALGKTSPSGLRETFLQREGRLRFEKGAWQLLVQPRTFDMLIDRLPWGFKVIKHPWMNAVVYVEWR